MKKSLKFWLIQGLPRPVINGLAGFKAVLTGDYLALRRRLADNERNSRLLALYVLRQQAEERLVDGREPFPSLNQYELSVCSQNGEDGILHFLFAICGTTNRRFVEFGIGDGRQCNTANLSLNFDWSGLLLEIDGQKAAAAQSYYQATHVTVAQAKVTSENINQLLLDHNLTGEIDLLSIDIDGNDYWVWQAIMVIQPRVVVIEYNPSFGPTESVTVPYDPDFNRFAYHSSGFYHGASLAALVKLGHEKGYLLAGCDSSGTNAFFVRQDVAGHGKVKALAAADAFFPSFHRSQSHNQAEQFAQIAHLPRQRV